MLKHLDALMQMSYADLLPPHGEQSERSLSCACRGALPWRRTFPGEVGARVVAPEVVALGHPHFARHNRARSTHERREASSPSGRAR